MPENVVKNRLCKPIDSLAINREDLLRFLEILQERANAACEMECNHIGSITPAEKLEKSLEDLRSCAPLKLTIVGYDGEELFGLIEEVFNSVSFPAQIKTLYVNSDLMYKARFNYYPRNRFEVFIDFSKPKVLDFSFTPSDATPNDSKFCVEGYDNTWANGVFSEIDNFFAKRCSKLSRIHKNTVYDLIVWTLGIPIGFWTCYKMSPYINDTFSSRLMESALYVYVFFFSLIVLRILFHYFRWLYPKIQYQTSKDRSLLHRGFFYVIATGIIVTFLYDVLSLFFSS
ncbi:hypothetical protein [Flagellimonas nanhaiensis]|uniref:Uncharacterized protein n=1 Tax=Flagellimonas nanhaiensis TaxID=2292706 RepID=A0A371JLP2_9FLAO|nr:hypothetical protein [Allomuricauda nanhaiensis]RDY57923.1 hypothetical protein DX873_17405 [Allomuricauda nanhaiensis]